MPFEMEDDVNPNKNECTMCTGDKTGNIWFVNGKCKLDDLTYDQVHYVLQHVPRARQDLERITQDESLLQLARETPLTESPLDDDARAAARINANTLPMYTVLRGNSDGGIR